MEKKVDPRITAFIDAFDAGIEYCKPHWEQYARLWQFWHGKRPEALEATYSKINLNLFHSTVQDRIPKLYENVFSRSDFIQVKGNTPVAEFTADAAQDYLLDLLNDRLRIRHNIFPTMQTALIGGTAYRMPHVTYRKNGDKYVPTITSKDLEFFHVIPAPGGGHVNPHDHTEGNAVPWVMIIDWWEESKIRALAEQGVLEKEGVRRLLDRAANDNFDEDVYRDRFATVGNLVYTSESSYRKQLRDTADGSKRRRVVHWMRRDRHLIIGEDSQVIYDQPYDGVIPLAKYMICPDANNWFGISYLSIQEDILMAMMMNFNYRMDNLSMTMFPTTWVREDVASYKKYTENDFIPKPHDIKFYPASLRNEKIQDIVRVDRREEVGPQAFMEEDRMKAIRQEVAGMMNTTRSMGDVTGNKTATGVTSILAELSGRPNMESTIFEQAGLREEAMLLLRLVRKVVTEPQTIRATGAGDGFNWRVVDPDDLDQEFTVRTYGTQYLSERNQTFQRLLAFWPFINNNPVWDQYEANRQAMIVADVLPDPDAAMVQPSPMAGMAGMGAAPGGMASAMDMTQATRSTQNRTGVEPRTGRQARASEVNA